MDIKPLVSVLMTAYNRDNYLAAAIESVLASSYTNFELIIVDDGSVDNTVSIAREYKEKDSRIQLYVNELNLGDYPNRNKAASYAKGRYIKYLDSDDYLYPFGLEAMVANMEAFPEAGWGLCSLPPPGQQSYPFMLTPAAAYEYHFFGPGLFHKGPSTSIFRKEAFQGVNGFDQQRMVSDVDMWHKLALHYPVVLMGNGLVWTRSHEKQELAEVDRYIKQYEIIKWKYLKDPACPLTVAQLRSIRNKRLKRYMGFILSGIKNLNFRQVSDYAKCFYFVSKVNLKKALNKDIAR
ncbi:MAG: glycosyltransferase family A protein [Ferruginibacter sp.]